MKVAVNNSAYGVALSDSSPDYGTGDDLVYASVEEALAEEFGLCD